VFLCLVNNMQSNNVLIAVLCGLGVFFALKKNNASDAQSENIETKEKILDIEKDIAKTNGLVQAEETKREDLKKEMTEKTNESLTPEEIADYFNRSK